MRACMDVDYRTGLTVAACVLFRYWADAAVNPVGRLCRDS